MRALALLLVLSGCLILEGDDDELDCYGPQLMLRDSQTGACVAVGRTSRDCQACGNCVPASIDSTQRAICGLVGCEKHDEATCLAATYCRAVYSAGDGSFLACWGTALGGASSTGTCAGLDAQDCSRHDNCSAWYGKTVAGTAVFDHCGDEAPAASCAWVDCPSWSPEHCVQECAPCDTAGGASCAAECHATCVADQPCSDHDCGLGATCAEHCVRPVPDRPAQCFGTCEVVSAGDPGTCDGAVTCAAGPPSCPAGTTPGKGGGCYTGYCIPLTACSGGSPGTCVPGRTSGHAPDCPESTVAGTIVGEFTGYCIPIAACGDSPLGTCEPATRTASPPWCPDGTVPGTIDGDYTGACIPVNQCPRLPCDGLFTDEACAARSDCRAIESGVDCTCTAVSCICTAQQFERCEAVASVGNLAGAAGR